MKSQNQAATDFFRSIEDDLFAAIKDSGRGFARIKPGQGFVFPNDQGLSDDQLAKLSFAAALGRRSVIIIDDALNDSTGPRDFRPKNILVPLASVHAVLLWDLGLNEFVRKELLRFINNRARAHILVVYSVPARLDEWLTIVKKYAPAGTEITVLRTYSRFSVEGLFVSLRNWVTRKYRAELIEK